LRISFSGTIQNAEKINNNRVFNYVKHSENGDIVSFSSRSPFQLRDIISDLQQAKDIKWVKFRKCDTKLSSAREYDHPEYGKIRVGMTLEFREDHYPFDTHGDNLKAFIEIPSLELSTSSSNTDNDLFKLVNKIIDPQITKQFQARASREKELFVKRYTRMLEKYVNQKE
jgi:hypothetical protein